MSDLPEDIDLLGDFNILGIHSVKIEVPFGCDRNETSRTETKINAYKTECGRRPIEFLNRTGMVELKMGPESYISYNISEHTIFVKSKGHPSMSILINAELREHCMNAIKGEQFPRSSAVWYGSVFINLLMLLKINIEKGSCVSPQKILDKIKSKKPNQ